MSFEYDDMIPRDVPQPVPFVEVAAKPSVPEVSLVLDQEISNRVSNPNRSILKGSSAINKQENKLYTDIETTPTESYNTWRWKNLSQQNLNGDNDKNKEVQRRPVRFDDHKYDSNFRNDQVPPTTFQRQNFDTSRQINVENHYNHQRIEPLPRNYHRSVEIHNVCEQSDEQLKYLKLHNAYDNTASDVHCHSSQRIHSNATERTSDLNKKYSPVTLESRSPYNTPKKYHESRQGNEHHFNRNFCSPTVSHENNDYHFSHSQNHGLPSPCSPTSNHDALSHHYSSLNHEHKYNNHNLPHCEFSNAQRCHKGITCNAVHNSKQVMKCCDCVGCTQSENQNFIKNMLNIIQTQNIQILKLQDQIKQLIHLHSTCHNFRDKTDVSTSPNTHLGKGKRSKGSPSETLPIIKEHSDSNVIELQKVSVGVMTSGVNSYQPVNSSKKCECKRVVTPPQAAEKRNLQNDHNKCKNESGPNLQRQDRSVVDLNGTEGQALDKSFTLNEADLEIGTIAEQIPSPTSSVHVDMQDYNSSSYEDSESSESSSEEGDSREAVGWTFYNNVVGQVNNILNKKASSSKPPPDSFDRVRNATIEHFRKLGISFTDVDNTISKKVTFDASMTPHYDAVDKIETDITMPFNALAMQCVHEELRSRYPDKMKDFLMYNVASGNANLSFTTLHHLERYHLLHKNQDQMFQQQPCTPKESHVRRKVQKRKKKKKESDPTQYQPRKAATKNSVGSKILDITTLKQQPKLI